MHVLLVEDDADTAAAIANTLRQAGNDVETVADGRRGLSLATNQCFDVVIVDRMLPEIDGLSLVASARAAGIDSPILFLTALSTVGERVAGLQAGGDDYLTKPFSHEELLARVNALGRRTPFREAQPVLRVGNLALDRLRRVVRRGEEPIDLQQREIRILEVLMLNAGDIVTRAMLLEQVWDFRFDPGTNIVETHMSRIRRKIDAPGERPLIHTIRGAGYVIRAP